MQIDVVSSEAWATLGDELKSNFSGQLFVAGNDVQLRSFRGVGHAVYEVAQTLMQLYSHKRAVGSFKGLSSAYEFMFPLLLREGFQIQSGTVSDFQTLQTWCDQLKKETNYVLVAEDHPITGELYPVDELDRILNEKKVFLLRVSHAKHFNQVEDIRPYTARLLSFGVDLATAVYGSKFRVQGITAPQMGWDKQLVIQKIQRKRKRVFDQTLVEAFESAFPDWRYFGENAKRLYDRAIMVFPNVNADAMVAELAAAMSLNKNSVAELLATTSQCSWEDPVNFKGWWQPAPSPEVLRGMLVISAEVLARKDFANLVKNSYDKLVSQQESFK